MAIPRDVDGILVTQGFRDLVDDARVLLGGLLAGSNLEIVQLTGAICSGSGVFRPGLWIVLHESTVSAKGSMSGSARGKLSNIADELRKGLKLS